MSKFWVDPSGNSLEVIKPKGARQVVAITGNDASTAAFQASTTAIRITATVNCWLNINATAAAHIGTSWYLAAGVVEYYWVDPADVFHVIQDSGGGYLSVVEAQ